MRGEMAPGGETVFCDYCGTAVRLLPTPVAGSAGDLLLKADFATPDAPGWTIYNRDNLTFKAGELWATFPASERIHAILVTPGHFADLDIAVTLRFIDGPYTHISAGLETRWTDAGDYSIHISAQGTYRIGWHNQREWGGELLNWTSHPSLNKQLGDANRLRVRMRGDQLRVYLNDTLASSLRDARFTTGFARLVISPARDAPITVAYSNLELRDAGAP